MSILTKLHEIRDFVGERETVGIDDNTLAKFANSDGDLREAIELGYKEYLCLKAGHAELLKLPERELIAVVQEGYVNFYDANAVNPYVAIAAKGPWLVTSHGSVLHDSGGYGMLGFGHSPKPVLDAMSQKHVMANVMTASFQQRSLIEKLRAEIGHARQGDKRHPFESFICLNSGSESVTIAARLADLNAAKLTSPGARHEGKKIMLLSLKGSFHGRTDRPAQASASSLPAYQQLASFRDRKNLMTVEPNNVEDLERVFEKAEKESIFFEMMLVEPVMGEGNPGVAMKREFYDRARELTRQMGTLLLMDSIQAGLRAQGCLSVTDYPGFESCDPPDLETYSKAVNAGQYPLSILAMTKSAAGLYARGLYGNTMTTNPRALAVACAVLDLVTPELRTNVKERGLEFVEKLRALKDEFPGVVTDVTGTGLLFALHLKEEGYKVVGAHGIERYMRMHGIGVIHGGKNALRFTPHFRITSAEVDFIIDQIRKALQQGPIFTA